VVLTILVQTDEDLLDQESVVEDDPASVSHLLIDELWVNAGCETELVTVPEDTAQFATSGLDAAWDDERGIAEVNESDLAPVFDTPSVS
jgi:hypothetical protein